MFSQLKGKITIPKNSYRGSGEAILFIRQDDNTICDKIIYLADMEDGNYELSPDETYKYMKAMLSCYQAVIPSLKMHFDLVESDSVGVFN